MKIQSVAAILFTCLLSCTYNGIERINNAANPVLREVHYNFVTGDKIADKTFTYDDRGNLTGEYFVSTVDPKNNSEITYEYNSGNWLVKKKEHYSQNSDNAVYVTEFQYKNGLKQQEETRYLGEDLASYRTQYFYTTNVPDSAEIFSYSTYDNKFHLNTTYIYQYDEQKRLVKSAVRSGVGETIYSYNSDLLTSTCDYGDVYGIVRERCISNEYNGSGQLIKTFKSSTFDSPAVANQLQEELFYKGELLDERRVYMFSYDGKLDITQIKYEY